MDSLTLFGHLFKTRCEAICIFLDFFTEKRGSHREIYNFFRKSHEIHCICKRFSIYCNKNCSGNMQILCPFAETTYAPSGDENINEVTNRLANGRNNLHPARGRKLRCLQAKSAGAERKQPTPRQGTKTRCRPHQWRKCKETTYTPSGDENQTAKYLLSFCQETTYAPSGDEKPYPDA